MLLYRGLSSRRKSVPESEPERAKLNTWCLKFKDLQGARTMSRVGTLSPQSILLGTSRAEEAPRPSTASLAGWAGHTLEPCSVGCLTRRAENLPAVGADGQAIAASAARAVVCRSRRVEVLIRAVHASPHWILHLFDGEQRIFPKTVVKVYPRSCANWNEI